jgi:hypothetical protein
MSEFNADIIGVLKDFADAVTEAVELVDNEGYIEAFDKASRHGASEAEINQLLEMSAEEQEAVFGKEVLPEYMQQEIQGFSQVIAQPMNW